MIVIPMKTVPGMNAREHWRVAHKRKSAERKFVACALVGKQKPPLPCSVLLTRIAPSPGLDDDNLAGSLKAVRDQVAEWLGVDDRDRLTVRYRYAQRRGAQKQYEVHIEFGEPAAGAQFNLLEVVA